MLGTPPSEPNAPLAHEAKRAGLTTARVLIVDDNAMNIALARIVLEGENFEVEAAADGLQAMQKVASFRPELILMDIQIPGSDGLELTQTLKRDPTTRHILVIAFTAFAGHGDEAKLRTAGCDGSLAKPIDVKTFGSQVRSLLEASRVIPNLTSAT
ncbi:MAG: two-component system, cell cycle response regulator DivK [Gammaproteobacteria bacterium]|nr:two-component system, cell cycle response regulator DivK [Gammaproteobacteria bacterium]